eukprot:CAMPEP_0172361758 /NCGR_PEP_ID=MMETSP1060-20121228/5540_1 /TAXON_ID=37318 /ORGANISM="Pseudo-nitzschia pungens, Strain cf. cingulata" /LENGTH=107 /DNA_ID=CAMNT_0013084121 /DNA_START=291 /DNA_END=614 /DNA_ORIENTATION=+
MEPNNENNGNSHHVNPNTNSPSSVVIDDNDSIQCAAYRLLGPANNEDVGTVGTVGTVATPVTYGEREIDGFVFRNSYLMFLDRNNGLSTEVVAVVAPKSSARIAYEI